MYQALLALKKGGRPNQLVEPVSRATDTDSSEDEIVILEEHPGHEKTRVRTGRSPPHSYWKTCLQQRKEVAKETATNMDEEILEIGRKIGRRKQEVKVVKTITVTTVTVETSKFHTDSK